MRFLGGIWGRHRKSFVSSVSSIQRRATWSSAEQNRTEQPRVAQGGVEQG